MAVNPKIPVKTVAEFITYAKAHPDSVSFGSPGNGSPAHLAGEWFNQLTGTKMVHVPYKGTGPALNDLLGGQVSASFTDVLTALPHVKAGKLRALGIATATRSQALPELPTIAEQGVPGYDVSVFFGVVAPAGTPADRIAKLNQAFVDVLASPKVKELFAAQGLEPAPDHAPAQLARFIAAQRAIWAGVVKQSGAQLD